MPVIHLIRHARPATTGVLVGAADIPLADGIVPPAMLEVEAILTSPLSRARGSAELLFPGRSIQVMPTLQERALGDWELRTWSEVEAGWPDLAKENWLMSTPPNGEAWADFEARILATWQAIDKTKDTAIVAHLGVNSLLHHFITGRDFLPFQQDYLETISLVIPD